MKIFLCTLALFLFASLSIEKDATKANAVTYALIACIFAIAAVLCMA